uniref:phospholipase A and acyltransferase 1-like isoform X2 n=1 Tax=Panthera onca TaxID=9690 RepID=UPI0029544A86|nr:phospholipase A and acyltransferase 1-like isoform X2 [Panthera onca]
MMSKGKRKQNSTLVQQPAHQWQTPPAMSCGHGSGDLLGAGFSIICSVLSSKAVVRLELLRDVVGHCRYRVNNRLDHKYKPRPVNVIIYSAKKKIGEEMEYRLLGKNCEHFVTDLRYGVPHSRQVVRKSLGQPSTVTRLRKRAHRQGVCSRSTGLCNGSSICLCKTWGTGSTPTPSVFRVCCLKTHS